MDGDAALLALARKYRTLGAVRREKQRSGEHTPRETMRSLAREFPGSLRELDTLSLPEIDRRAAALEAAASGAPESPWMRWMAEYHALMRAALSIKARLRGARALGQERAAELARDASLRAGAAVDAAFALACARPPGGRLAAVVAQELGARFAQPPEAILSALFPRKPTSAEVSAARSARQS